MSHSTWVGGLKWELPCLLFQFRKVPLYMGGWIEILLAYAWGEEIKVPLYMGGWIEIFMDTFISQNSLSHSTWVGGLKYNSCRRAYTQPAGSHSS